MAPASNCSTRLRSELGADAAHFIDAGTLSFSLAALYRSRGFDAGARCRRSRRARREPSACSKERRWTHFCGAPAGAPFTRWDSSIFWTWRGCSDCLPPRRALLCIQPGRIDWSEKLSAPVRPRLPEAAAKRGTACSAGEPLEPPRRDPDPRRSSGSRPSHRHSGGGLGGGAWPPFSRACHSARAARREPCTRGDRLAQPPDELRRTVPSSSARSARAKYRRRSRRGRTFRPFGRRACPGSGGWSIATPKAS